MTNNRRNNQEIEEERLNQGSLEQEFYDDEIGQSEEGYPVSHRQRRRAKNKKGKKIALTILVLGGLTAAAIFGTQAVHSAKETRRVDSLLTSYAVEDYCVFPTQVTSDRAYDITYSNGSKLVDRIRNSNIDYINIGGQFYTEDGKNIAILTYDVTYIRQTEAIRVSAEGENIYMAPSGYSLYGKTAYRYETQRVTKIVPESTDYNYITFPGATSYQIVGEPTIVQTLPFSVIESSTLICDVPDNAVLNENNECDATLALAPKKR